MSVTLNQINFNEIKRVIFASSIAGSMIDKGYVISIMPITPEELSEMVKEALKNNIPIINFIGHAPTVSLLNKLLNLNLQPTRAEYKINPNDLIIMVSLSQRQQISGQDVSVTDFNQLVIRIVKVIQVI